MKRYLSVKIKLLMPLLFILVIVFIASSFFIIERESNEAETTLIENAISFSSLSAENVVENYDLYYQSGFYKYSEIIEELISLNRDLFKIQLIDVNGKILFDSDEILGGKYNENIYHERYVSDPELLSSLTKSTYTLDLNNKEYQYFMIVQPFIESFNAHRYSVVSFYSYDSLNMEVQNIFFEVLLLTIVFIIISCIMIFLVLDRLITIPVKKLSNKVKVLAEGAFDDTIPINSNDEIGELTSSVNKMGKDLKKSRERLERLIEEKENFIVQLSHDLKTPLGPILNLLKIIIANEDDKENKEMLDVMQKNVFYMKNLVNNSLDLARLNSPNVISNLSEVNIKQFINNHVKNKLHLIKNKLISFKNNIPDDLTVNINEYEFEVVISNLIQNAIYYNKKGGIISVNAHKEDGYLKIAIKDTGIGMTKEQIEHAFEEFYKADVSRHNLSSTGLGLSICKRAIEKYGGRIWIESEGKKKGITVFFTLPR